MEILRKVFEVQDSFRISQFEKSYSSLGKPISIYLSILVVIGTQIIEAGFYDWDLYKQEIGSNENI